MKKYMAPKLEVIELAVEDIMLISLGGIDGEVDFFGDDSSEPVQLS